MTILPPPHWKVSLGLSDLVWLLFFDAKWTSGFIASLRLFGPIRPSRDVALRLVCPNQLVYTFRSQSDAPLFFSSGHGFSTRFPFVGQVCRPPCVFGILNFFYAGSKSQYSEPSGSEAEAWRYKNPPDDTPVSRMVKLFEEGKLLGKIFPNNIRLSGFLMWPP